MLVASIHRATQDSGLAPRRSDRLSHELDQPSRTARDRSSRPTVAPFSLTGIGRVEDCPDAMDKQNPRHASSRLLIDPSRRTLPDENSRGVRPR